MDEDVVPKPPLGVMPQYIWLENRLVDVMECSLRYRRDENYLRIPDKYLIEMKDLINRTLAARAVGEKR